MVLLQCIYTWLIWTQLLMAWVFFQTVLTTSFGIIPSVISIGNTWFMLRASSCRWLHHASTASVVYLSQIMAWILVILLWLGASILFVYALATCMQTSVCTLKMTHFINVCTLSLVINIIPRIVMQKLLNSFLLLLKLFFTLHGIWRIFVWNDTWNYIVLSI